MRFLRILLLMALGAALFWYFQRLTRAMKERRRRENASRGEIIEAEYTAQPHPRPGGGPGEDGGENSGPASPP
ncbi:MAG: hypothetical protein GMKNLPBB_00718 [Myxococcota bacterium]|nr:hypothetical protein [Myxococcota bacterium]